MYIYTDRSICEELFVLRTLRTYRAHSCASAHRINTLPIQAGKPFTRGWANRAARSGVCARGATAFLPRRLLSVPTTRRCTLRLTCSAFSLSFTCFALGGRIALDSVRASPSQHLYSWLLLLRICTHGVCETLSACECHVFYGGVARSLFFQAAKLFQIRMKLR